MRGGDTSGLRAYNERLIVSALLRTGALSKAEIARETGLSGQAASVIVNALVDEELLIKLDKVRGQVGQPSTPIAPNPEGAFSIGVKIGRRSIEAILVNMLGEVVTSHAESYAAPLPGPSLKKAVALARKCVNRLPSAARERIVGLGVAMPGDLHAWSVELGLARGALDGWREADVPGALEAATGLPVTLYNDATAACAAEMIAGAGITTRSALYVYLGMFIGGGVVIDGRLYRGEQFNAGAIGSMPVTGAEAEGRPRQLIHSASILLLEQALAAAGIDAQAAISEGGIEAGEAPFRAWTDAAAPEIARAIVAALSVIDFETVVIDGILHPGWRDAVTAGVEAEMAGFNDAGLTPASVTVGSIGPMARVLGAAMLPLRARFSPDPDLVVRPVQAAGPDAAPLRRTA